MKKLEGRIRYDENWRNEGEYYVFEIYDDEYNEWSLDTAYKLIDDRLSYQALTKVREWQKLDIGFHFV